MVDRSIPGNALLWRKSSASGEGDQDGGQEDCVEVAAAGRSVLVRDSRAPSAGVLVLDAVEWRSLLRRIVKGDLEW